MVITDSPLPESDFEFIAQDIMNTSFLHENTNKTNNCKASQDEKKKVHKQALSLILKPLHGSTLQSFAVVLNTYCNNSRNNHFSYLL